MPLDKPLEAVRNTPNLNRQLPPSTAKSWLLAGWNDFKAVNMEASLLYGVVVTAISILIVIGLFVFKLDYLLLPALAAFMIIGPIFALGLYEKSRRIEQGNPVGIGQMMAVKTESSKDHFVFIGLVLTLLVMLWLRAGVLLYALFFGMHSFPSFGGVFSQVFTNFSGIGLVITGSLFGALFAAFAFAVSVISIPLLLDEESDAFSAIGTSIVLTWNNLPVMMTWGAIVLALIALSLLTGLLGLIIVFPVLGHATWHMYRAIRQQRYSKVIVPAVAEEKPTT